MVASELHVLLDILPPLGRYYSRVSGEESQFPSQGAGEGATSDPLKHYKLMVYSAAQRLPEQKCKHYTRQHAHTHTHLHL